MKNNFADSYYKSLNILNDIKTSTSKESFLLDNFVTYFVTESVISPNCYYQKLFSIISVNDFFLLFSSKLYSYLNNDKYSYFKNVFFNVMSNVNMSKTIDFVSKKEVLFNNYINYLIINDYMLANVKYNNFKKIIILLKGNVCLDFVYLMPSKYLEEILDDDIEDDILVNLVKNLPLKYKNKFFMFNKKSLYLFTKFNILEEIKKGVKFNDNIVKTKFFFEELKSNSLIEFRSNINYALLYNNPLIIKNNCSKYLEEMISSYDIASGLFKEYFNLLYGKDEDKSNKYLFDLEVLANLKCMNNLSLQKYLIDVSSQKMSELIIDFLFQDNIYNVWLNINEMLRFNKQSKNNLLDKNDITFYNLILNIDSLNKENKMKLYNNFKDKKIYVKFYMDLRRIRNLAYDKIKEDLFIADKTKTKLSSLGDKYGIEIYDLRNMEYKILARSQNQFKDNIPYFRSCYTLISNENNEIFGYSDRKRFLYGYNSFENEFVFHMYESDVYSSNLSNKFCRYVNRIMSSNELSTLSNNYSEIQIANKKDINNKNRWIGKKPDFLICYDLPRDNEIKESKRLDIPIVLIKHCKKNYNTLDNKDDYYINCLSEENKVKKSR